MWLHLPGTAQIQPRYRMVSGASLMLRRDRSQVCEAPLFPCPRAGTTIAVKPDKAISQAHGVRVVTISFMPQTEYSAGQR